MKHFVYLLSIVLLFSCKKTETVSDSLLQAKNMMNVAYGSDAAQKMDIYLPAGRSADTTKLIILVHGGAWTIGDKTDFDTYIPQLRQRLPHYAIANINYRLASSSGNFFPTQENDMKAAVQHLVQNGGTYGISQKLVLLGASAGGHMSLLQAYKYSTPKAKAVVSFFGPTDMVGMYNSATDPTTRVGIQLLMGGTPATNPGLYASSSPVNFVDAQSPPTLLLHGSADDIVPLAQSQSLRTKLQTAGVVHQLVVYPNLGHDFWPAATMNDAFDRIELFVKQNVQ